MSNKTNGYLASAFIAIALDKIEGQRNGYVLESNIIVIGEGV